MGVLVAGECCGKQEGQAMLMVMVIVEGRSLLGHKWPKERNALETRKGRRCW